MAKRRKPHRIEKEVPIERYTPPNLDLQFSDSIVVQHHEHEFLITFLQIQHPLVITQDELSSVKKVQSKAVARLVVTPSQMALIVEVFKRNFDKYTAKYGPVDLDEERLIGAGSLVESDVSHETHGTEVDSTEVVETE